MEEFTKEGRKLRPRKNAAGSSVRSEKVDFRSSDSFEHRSHGEHRSFGERKSYSGNGEHRNFSSNNGERKSYGEGRSYGEHRNFGERKSYSGNGERKQYGERKSYGEGRSYGEHRSFGEHKSYSGNGERRSFGSGNGERKQFGERKQYGERRSFDRKPAGRKPATFDKNSNEGINRMISRRPVVNGNEIDQKAPQMIQDVVRLNKFIANSGVCSRREADTLIQAGVVTVNGEVVTELGTKVNIYEDDIRFNGQRLKGEEKMYIVMNKPKGFVTTASDPHAEKTVLDLVKDCPSRVYPVGRLDKNTTGVLMLTNDGEIAERLTHPSYDKKKIYQVILDRPLEQEDYDKILVNVTLSDGDVKADELEYIDENDRRKLGIEIHSGKNRIVRRIFESLGYNVRTLDRVYFAGLTKKGLKKGEWRYLTEGEVNILKMGAYV
ncbi:MAG: rRNA pseudouridine synthase [Bacteroidales bacterium]|nr:rRNA pseudouridine synthase [Candidatus Cryptobacteroides choladohippi]